MKRTHATDSASDGKKKTRFVAPEDDPARFDEDVADQLETARDTAKGRRGKVRTEGYESDSSDEGESVVRSRAKKPEGAEDEDDDMLLTSILDSAHYVATNELVEHACIIDSRVSFHVSPNREWFTTYNLAHRG